MFASIIMVAVFAAMLAMAAAPAPFAFVTIIIIVVVIVIATTPPGRINGARHDVDRCRCVVGSRHNIDRCRCIDWLGLGIDNARHDNANIHVHASECSGTHHQKHSSDHATQCISF